MKYSYHRNTTLLTIVFNYLLQVLGLSQDIKRKNNINISHFFNFMFILDGLINCYRLKHQNNIGLLKKCD